MRKSNKSSQQLCTHQASPDPYSTKKIAMKAICSAIIILFFWASFVIGQDLGSGINRRIQPPLQPQSIAQQLAALEQQLVEANREVEFWRNARFYNDEDKERMRKEKLIYWSQRTVDIRNKMTKLKQDRAYYQHKHYDGKRYYYKKD